MLIKEKEGRVRGRFRHPEKIKFYQTFSPRIAKLQNQANALEDHLRNDEFPPYLWMEYNRINRTFVDVSKLLIDLVDRMYKYQYCGSYNSASLFSLVKASIRQAK